MSLTAPLTSEGKYGDDIHELHCWLALELKGMKTRLSIELVGRRDHWSQRLKRGRCGSSRLRDLIIARGFSMSRACEARALGETGSLLHYGPGPSPSKPNTIYQVHYVKVLQAPVPLGPGSAKMKLLTRHIATLSI